MEISDIFESEQFRKQISKNKKKIENFRNRTILKTRNPKKFSNTKIFKNRKFQKNKTKILKKSKTILKKIPKFSKTGISDIFKSGQFQKTIFQ